MKKNTLLILIVSLFSLSFFTACDPKDTPSSNAQADKNEQQNSEQIKPAATKENYIVAALSTFPPFVSRDETGDFIGFDVDILKAIGEREGFEVTYLVHPWKGIFDTLEEGTHQIISSAVVITPERQQLADFSDPYFQSSRMALVTDTNLQSFDQLKGKRFVTQAGTSNEPILREYFGEDIDLIGVETQYQEIKELLAGHVDVAFDDSGVISYYAKQLAENGRTHAIKHPTYPGDDFGFAVKRGNRELLDKINRGLKAIRQDGTYARIYKKWFGDQ